VVKKCGVRKMPEVEIRDLDIAVIGMAGRFPGANTIKQFWDNICQGIESITVFSDEDLIQAGVDPNLINNPNYIKAAGILEEIDKFDAGFFGFTPGEAKLMDPQQRIFFELAWHALETAGYNPASFGGRIGILAGVGSNTYFLRNILTNFDLKKSDLVRQIWLANDANFFATQIAYKLNLKGPAITIHTACSTSLVAIHMACQSLLNYQSDMMLAGGIKILVPQKEGYLYKEGEVMSPDGHCRPFDKEGCGTLSSSGGGVVVLKRLEDAVNDGDNILAVIKGSALNNDGASKVGYSAVSVEGQYKVISEALQMAEVTSDSITYVETHGTATPLGDPVEIKALTKAFAGENSKRQYCAIGSVKSNIGHTDTAAGVAGFIKAVLAVKNGLIPPSLNYSVANPNIDFKNSPFYVNTELQRWECENNIRRAGVSSFGIGGTNAHLILESFDCPKETGSQRPFQLLTFSGRSKPVLNKVIDNFREHLCFDTNNDFSDVAYTQNSGRRDLEYRSFLVCQGKDDCLAKLQNGDAVNVAGKVDYGLVPSVVFMFPGQGSQYVNMARDLYESEVVFRAEIELCARIVKSITGYDLRDYLFPDTGAKEASQTFLTQTINTHPIIFTVEYALAKLWISWGINPEAMIGHSIGEYVAACLAGVFSLEEGLQLIIVRGRLIQSTPGGSMLSVTLTEAEARQYVNERVSIAAVNTPTLLVFSGETAAIEQLKKKVESDGQEAVLLHTSHAFHSPMMSPIIAEFTQELQKVKFNQPQIPYISNVTGNWIKNDDAVNPQYWVNHLRNTVRFMDGLNTLATEKKRSYIEVGPGNTLTVFAKQGIKLGSNEVVVSSLRHPHQNINDGEQILNSLGTLWTWGVSVDWNGFYNSEWHHRVVLPVYPFEKNSYWIDERTLNNTFSKALTASADQVAVTDDSRTAVTEQQYGRPNLPNEYVAPRNELEESITGIWEELFGLSPLGVTDNFFLLGGHSLLATQIISRVRDLYTIDIPLRRLIEAPTIAEVAEALIEVLTQNDDGALASFVAAIEATD
jgi:phthiocerol/phenolphthiocerol synthesis type-I polyketide synthase E